MKDVFISEFFELNDELDTLGVFDAIITTDSHFFINLLRLKSTTVPQFSSSYKKINQYFDKIMILLSNSKTKDDKLYKEALRRFSFSGVKGINLGFSETGVDAGFGKGLSKQVINDAFEIVQTGSKQPEIFQLVGLFEENVAADRLSDMVATLISEDIYKYTRWVNETLGLTESKYPNIVFKDGIAFNPYKGCDLLYLPRDILHELPIARDWNDIDRVISENQTIRAEVNEVVGKEWSKMAASQKKSYLREYVFKDSNRCARVIDGYRSESISECSLKTDMDYFIADTFKKMRKSGVFSFVEHSGKKDISSWYAAIKVLDIFKDWVENNKGWNEIVSSPSRGREKTVQRLIHLAGKYYCDQNNIDLSFEVNAGPGPVDLKVSRGTDKTVVEVKLSSNQDYMHGFEEQIEDYARAENTSQRIFVYVQVEEHSGRDRTIRDKYTERTIAGENPPLLYMIDSRTRTSASKK